MKNLNKALADAAEKQTQAYRELSLARFLLKEKEEEFLRITQKKEAIFKEMVESQLQTLPTATDEFGDEGDIVHCPVCSCDY